MIQNAAQKDSEKDNIKEMLRDIQDLVNMFKYTSRKLQQRGEEG